MNKISPKALLTLLSIISIQIVMGQSLGLYNEDFRNDGNNSRYVLSHTWDTLGTVCKIAKVATFNNMDLSKVITNVKPAGFIWGVENATRAQNAPANKIVTLTTRALKIDSFSSLTFSFDFAAAKSLAFEGFFVNPTQSDFANVDYSLDGGGIWTRILQFRAGPSGSSSEQYLFNDENFDNIGNPGEDTVTTVLRTYDSTFAVSGDSIIFRISLKSTFLREDMAVGNILVIGNASNAINTTLNRLLYPYMGYTIDNLNTPLWCQSNPSAISYQFEISAPGFTTDTVTSTSSVLRLSNATDIMYNKTYNVRHRIITGTGPGIWSDAYYGFWPITVSAPNVELLQCGSTIPYPNTNLGIRDLGTATNYRVRIQGPGGIDTLFQLLNPANPTFNLTQLGIDTFGVFTMSVEAEIDGSYTGLGPECNVTVQTPAAPQILNLNCGGTLNNTSSIVYCSNVPQADFYEWRIIGGDLGIKYFNSSSNKVRLIDAFPGLLDQYGEFFVLAARFNNAGVFSNYGSGCSFTLQVPTLDITFPTCGSILPDYNATIYTANIPNATYEFNVTNGVFDTTFINSVNLMRLTDLDTSENLNNFDVRVRPIIPGETSAFGSFCNFNFIQPRLAQGAKRFSFQSDEVKVYPNPVKDVLFISNNANDIQQIELRNINGAVIRNDYEIDKSSALVSINFRDLPNGVYILNLMDRNGERYNFKIVH